MNSRALSRRLYPTAIGSNDGRCVQMAGTQSVQADDLHILGIPRSRQTVAIIYPQYSTGLQGFPPTSGQVLTEQESHSHCVNVVRVRPRTSGSITDLLLALACMPLVTRHSTSEKLNPDLSGDHWIHRAASHHCEVPGSNPTSARLGLLGGRDLTRYRNQPDKSLHQSGAAMHHHPKDLERALNLSIQATS